jgi:hypothetical protein
MNSTIKNTYKIRFFNFFPTTKIISLKTLFHLNSIFKKFTKYERSAFLCKFLLKNGKIKDKLN